MAVQAVTKPLVLDETAQTMVTKLQAIATALTRNAGQIDYDNTISSLSATKVQSAIDEVKGITDSLNASLTQNYYTKTATDGLLYDKLNASNFVTVNNGTFAGLVKQNEVWLIIVQRISTTQTCVLVVSNYNGTINVKEIVKDSGFAYLANDQGTVNIKYSDSNQGVYGGAYKLK